MIALPWNASHKQLRQFAWFAPLGFAAIGWMVVRLGGSWNAFWILTGIGVLLLPLGLVRPGLVRPFWIASLALAFPIGMVVTNAALAALYFLAIAPLGLLFRLSGRDTLAQKTRGWRTIDQASDTASYWRQS